MISEKTQRIKYVLADFFSANMAWFTYNCLRFHLGGVRGYSTLGDFMSSSTIIIGQIAFPLMMMGVYCLSGYYNEVFRKSRLSELMTTFKTAVINTLLAFFIALINDMMNDNRSFNYEIILVLLALLFFLPIFSGWLLRRAHLLILKTGDGDSTLWLWVQVRPRMPS